MADKRFQLTFDVNANINPIKGAIGELKGSLSNLKIPDTFKKSIESTVASLEKEITNFESIASKGFSNMGDFNKANRSFEKISDLFSKLGIQVKNLKGVDPNKFLPAETLKKTQSLQQAWLKLKQTVDKGVSTEGIEKVTQALEKQKQKLEELQATEKKYRDQQQSEINRRNELQAKLGDKDTKGSLLYEQRNLTKRVRDAELSGNTKNNATYTNNKKALEDLNKVISSHRAEITAAEQKIADFDTKIIGATADVEKQSTKVDNLTKDLEELRNASQKAPEGIKQFIEDLKALDGIDTEAIDDAGEDLEKLQQILTNYQAGKAKEIADGINKIGENAEKLDQPVDNAAEELHKFGDECSYADDKSRELENLANQVKQFFSIGNTVQLFKRAIRSAFDTIKELDAVMTQTAVVTDFTVGDMWAQLPEYTKRANELGVSVKGAYEAATLYYQQGLETNQVMGVSNETLKMAKIAAIDYATATDYMTSALRGFNMEVNEDSARKVNDIYSQLAAKTAADTEEISIAMSKTAPLAHNAGMEIETTAALLSQMIETTREAPETLGTAMKTVIARFQELKKDPALIEPVEGEIVDANKIEGALRTIGVALRDTNGQFRDLDDVFLEISQKWNSLDTNTQRYIATIAAGSRQQSRFIAMMANYDRTMELVEYANNSAGASQKQFEKTLDSMQSKLDRLKNAWNEFTMGLANNSVIKTIVDLLTDLLNVINKIASGASGNNGLLKSLIDIGILMGGLKLGKAAFSGFFGWLQGSADKTGKGIGKKILSGLLGGKELDKKGGILKTLFANNTEAEVRKNVANFMGLNNRKKSLLDGLLNFKNEDTNLSQVLSNLNKKITSFRWDSKTFSGLFKTLKAPASEIGILGKELGKTFLNIFKTALPYALAIGVAVTAIVTAIKAIKANSLKGRIEAAEASTKRAQDAANQAKEAYDNLLEGKSGYNELQNKLDNLTYGTTAWKEALIEANGQVLELLQTFPQLAQYMSPGANGRLEISAEGWDTVLEQQQEAIRRTTNDLLGAQIYRANLENESIYKQLQKNSGIQRKGLLDELIKQYENNAAFFAKDKNGNYSQALKELAFEYNVSADKIYEAQNALKDYEVAIQENGTVINSYVDSLIANNGEIANLKPEIAESIRKVYNNSLAKNYNTKIDAEKGKILTGTGYKEGYNGSYIDSLLEEYRIEASGTTKNKLKEIYKYLANITGEEIDNGIMESKEAMAEAIARMRFGDEIEASINQVAELLKRDTSGGVQKILDVFGGEIGKISTDQLAELETEFSRTNATTASTFKKLGFKTQKEFEEVIKAMGYTTKDASGNIVADFKSFRQAFLDGVIDLEEGIKIAEKNLATNLAKSNFSTDQIALILGSLTTEQRVSLSTFSDKTSFLDQNTSNQALSLGTNIFVNGSDEEVTEFQDLIDSIDTSSPIQSIIALQEAATSNFETIRKEAELLLKTEQFSLSKGFQSFYLSDAYDQAKESLDELIKTNGKLSSKNIEELAESNSQLNNLLKIAGVSAEGLAKTLTAIETGKVAFDEITDSVLKAASATMSLDTKLGELQENLSNFDKGQDTNANLDSYKSLTEELIDYVSRGETGNEQVESIWTQIYGKDSYQKFFDSNFEGASEYLQGKLDLLADDGLAYLDNIVSRIQNRELTIEGFNIDWNDPEGTLKNLELTSEQFIANIQEGLGVTEQEATMIAGIFESYYPHLRVQLEMNDAQAQINEFISSVESGEKVAISAEEADALQAVLGDAVNVREQLEAANVAIIDYGQNAASVWEQIQKASATINPDVNFEGQSILEALNAKMTGNPDGTTTYEVDVEAAVNFAEQYDAPLEKVQELLEVAAGGAQNIEFVGSVDIENLADYNAALDEQKNTITEETQAALDGIIQDIPGTMAEALKQGVSLADISGGIQTEIGTDPYTVYIKYEALNQPFKDGTIRKIRKSTIPTNANGADGLPRTETILAGEEGYELAYNSHGAFLLGENGPEVTKLEKGTVIYPHDESKKILNGYSKSIFPNFKTGTIPNYRYAEGLTVSSPALANYRKTKTESIVSSSDASNAERVSSALSEAAETAKDITEETEKWENTVDWLYNMTQKVNQELRVRDKLERQYNRLLKTHTGTGEELRRLTNEEIVSLKKRQDMQREMIELRKKELHAYMMLNKEMMKYAIIDNWDDMTIHIAWDSINNITDKDEYDKAVDFLHRLEEVQGIVQDLEDDIEDIEDELIELKERGEEQYRDLEDRVLDALISEQQEMIDEQEKTNKAIKDAESSLIDAIQKNIDKMRQDRENEEKESSIAEKERRLTYLRQDTTGSNALEIKKLEDELAKEKQDYSDALIDQALKDLKDQNDEAQKQREKQIELAQSQLDWQEKTGYWVDEATKIVREGIGNQGIMDENSRLYQLLYNQEGVETMSNASRDWWKSELEKTIKEAYIYLANVLESQNNGNDIVESMKQNSQSWNTVSSSEQSALHAENERLAKEYEAATGEKLTYNSSEGAWYKENGERLYTVSKDDTAHDIVAKMRQNSNAWGSASESKQKELAAENEELAKRLKKVLGQDIRKENGVWYIGTRKLYDVYEKGGLADFTGPAWLDGSKSKPEMVLNAKDTQNFIQLKDILAGLRSGIVGNQEQSGDWYFDIDINVDEIANDYDVDKVADRVKQAIYKETTYRNVNAINFLK